MQKLYPSAEAALEGVLRDDMLIASGGFGLCGIPERLLQAIQDAGADGYTITTVNGGTLTAMMDGDNVVLRDAAGNTATVTQTDVEASNGVIHAIDTVLMPA